jgi:hypothetical protein
VLLGVGDDLDMEVSCVICLFVVVDAVISRRGRDVLLMLTFRAMGPFLSASCI